MSETSPSPQDRVSGAVSAAVGGAVVTAALAFLLSVANGGWEILLIGLPLVALCVSHVVFHWRRAKIIRSWLVGTIVAFVLSDLVLLGSALLIAHAGDSGSWVTIEALVAGGHYNSSPTPYFLELDILPFLVVPVGWVALVGATKPSRLVIAISLIVLVVASAGLFAGVASFANSGAKAGAEAAATQTSSLAALGGPPPHNCGGSAAPVHPRIPDTIWSQESGIAVGQKPVWLRTQGLTLEQGRAVEHLAAIPYIAEDIKKSNGVVPVYLTWITDADAADVISVHITDLGSTTEVIAKPAWYMHDPTLLVPTESKAIAFGPVPPYRIFLTQGMFPGTGCYEFKASWPSGGWTVIVALGK